MLKTQLRNPKTGELHKVILTLCQAKRIDHSILHEKYESRMEELRDKFTTSAKMRAQYEIYCRKRLAVVTTIRNALQEDELMLEIVQNQQN